MSPDIRKSDLQWMRIIVQVDNLQLYHILVVDQHCPWSIHTLMCRIRTHGKSGAERRSHRWIPSDIIEHAAVDAIVHSLQENFEGYDVRRSRDEDWEQRLELHVVEVFVF